MNQDEKGPMENLFEGLDLHAEFLSLDEIKTELRARGIAIDEFLREARGVIAASQKANRLSWMQVADEKKALLKSITTGVTVWAEKKDEEIRTAFAAFIEDREKEHAFAFRNKSKLTVQDMARMLDVKERLSRNASKEGAS